MTSSYETTYHRVNLLKIGLEKLPQGFAIARSVGFSDARFRFSVWLLGRTTPDIHPGKVA